MPTHGEVQLEHLICPDWIDFDGRFPGADVRVLPRPLSDHSPIIWQTNEGHGRNTYFKMDRSWLQEGGFKDEVKEVWKSQGEHEFGSAGITKRIDGLRTHLIHYRRSIRDVRCRGEGRGSS